MERYYRLCGRDTPPPNPTPRANTPTSEFVSPHPSAPVNDSSADDENRFYSLDNERNTTHDVDGDEINKLKMKVWDAFLEEKLAEGENYELGKFDDEFNEIWDEIYKEKYPHLVQQPAIPIDSNASSAKPSIFSTASQSLKEKFEAVAHVSRQILAIVQKEKIPSSSLSPQDPDPQNPLHPEYPIQISQPQSETQSENQTHSQSQIQTQAQPQSQIQTQPQPQSQSLSQGQIQTQTQIQSQSQHQHQSHSLTQTQVQIESQSQIQYQNQPQTQCQHQSPSLTTPITTTQIEIHPTDNIPTSTPFFRPSYNSFPQPNLSPFPQPGYNPFVQPAFNSLHLSPYTLIPNPRPNFSFIPQNLSNYGQLRLNQSNIQSQIVSPNYQDTRPTSQRTLPRRRKGIPDTHPYRQEEDSDSEVVDFKEKRSLRDRNKLRRPTRFQF